MTVFVPDPVAVLQPYADVRRAATAAGADFVVGDDGPPRLRDAEILVIDALPITADTLRDLARCQLIVRCGVGVDMIDVAAATARGIVVANAPTYCAAEVADHAAALILSFTRRIPALDHQIRRDGWSTSVVEMWEVRRLSALTLGIIGLGHIGRELARRMQPFGMRVLGYDPYVAGSMLHGLGVIPAALEDVLRASDIISLHVPLTMATRRLLGEAALALMKPTAVLVNTSRGAVVDETALIRALQEGRLYGAALDVMESEPPDPNNPLLQMDPQRLILTPHVAAASAAALVDLQHEVAAAVEAILEGYWPAATVNPSVVPKAPLRTCDLRPPN